jgi:hypothetical protein
VQTMSCHNKHITMFGRAMDVAIKSTMTEKHGAIIAKGGKIFASGCNTLNPLRTFGGCPEFGCYIHAEVAALLCFGGGRSLGSSRMYRKKRTKSIKNPQGTGTRRCKTGSLCGPGKGNARRRVHHESIKPVLSLCKGLTIL